MQRLIQLTSLLIAVSLVGCATPPRSDASKVELTCAQQCQSNLTTCSSGFKLFPVVAQQQCNDTYDVCVSSCPARSAQATPTNAAQVASSPAERLKQLEELQKSGGITKEEYEAKRKEILHNL